jgi:hypothetical protein
MRLVITEGAIDRAPHVVVVPPRDNRDDDRRDNECDEDNRADDSAAMLHTPQGVVAPFPITSLVSTQRISNGRLSASHQ